MIKGYEKSDLDLLYAQALPVKLDRLVVHSVSLRDISLFQYSRFSRWVTLLCLDEEKVLEMIPDFPKSLSAYDFLVVKVENNPEYKENILELLKLILHEDMKYNTTYKNFSSVHPEKNIILDRDNHVEFAHCVLERNKFKTETDGDKEKATKKAQEIKRRIAEYKKKLSKNKKSDDGDSLSLSDLIYILAIGMQKSPSDISSFDIYQMYECLYRLKIFKDYELSINALVHGADSESVDVVHWMSRPKEEN